MQTMHWDDLRHFLATARTGQLAKAASILAVDATTVARRIRRLEQSLGQSLFEQAREGQVLSEAGERLLLRAEAIERSMSEIDAGADRQSTAGLVRISVSEGFGTWFVAHHLRSFLEEHPDVHVDLVATSGFLSPSKRETDVAILLARPRHGPLISKKLSDYTLRLYASHRYIDDHLPIRDAADLRSHSLIGYIPDLIYAPELRYLNEIASELRLRTRSSSINAQYRLAASGAGIAILPCFIGDADTELVPLLPQLHIKRSFWLVTHEDTRRLRRIEGFVEWLIQTVSARRERLLGSAIEAQYL